jgi:hypothetical protein
MGAWSSRYRDVGQEAYTFNNHGTINLSTFETGDLIFFSEEFPASGLHRLTRRIRGKLWNNCGVVVKAPDLFPGQTLLLENAEIHPDDHLVDKLQLKTIEGGVRLVSLSDRLKSQQGAFPAMGIRKRGRPYGNKQATETFETFDAYNQWRTMKNLAPIMDGTKATDNQNLSVNALKDLKIMFASYAKLDLNELAGRALNRYCHESLQYKKIEVFAWPSEKDLKKQGVRVNE